MITVFTWKVVHWKKLWRKIGFRTANIELWDTKLDEGTYKLNWYFWKKIYPWVGTYLQWSSIFEAHFIWVSKNLYWREIEIILLEKIRENRKFESIEEIKKQITKDVLFAQKKKRIVFTFWTFDVFHKWHKYYLEQAKKYGEKVFTVIARDTSVESLKGKKPLMNQIQRKLWVEQVGIVDIVLLGDSKDPLRWIKKYSPHVICLWYDQIWYSELLKQYMKDQCIHIDVVKIPSYKEKIYKSSIINKEKFAKKNI